MIDTTGGSPAGHHHSPPATTAGKLFRRDFSNEPKSIPTTRSIRPTTSLSPTRRSPHRRHHLHHYHDTTTVATPPPFTPPPLFFSFSFVRVTKDVWVVVSWSEKEKEEGGRLLFTAAVEGGVCFVVTAADSSSIGGVVWLPRHGSRIKGVFVSWLRAAETRQPYKRGVCFVVTSCRDTAAV
nr:hypothetical protein [Tanacetum cinerariifolium]